MTTPGQVAPDGAYVIGGGQYKYGQALQEDFVRNLMMGGLRNIKLSNIADAVPLIEGALRKLPLDALRMTKVFLLGTTDADYVDVDTAVATIMRSLKVKEVFLTLGAAQALLDNLVSDIVKIFTGHANGLDALDKWWKDLSALLGLLTQPDQLLATLQDLLNKVWTLLTGVVNHPDKTLSDVVDALTFWFTNTFDALKNLLENVGKNFQALLDGIGSIFGLTGAGKTVAEAVQAISDWLSGVFKPVADGLAGIVKVVQDLLDGIFGLFGGTAGVGKTVAEVITTIQGWLSGPFKLVQDGIGQIVNWLKTFFEGIVILFTGSAPKTLGTGVGVTEALDAISKWLTMIFGPVSDGLAAIVKAFNAFIKGVTGLFGGAGTTVSEALAAMTGWFANFHKLLDALFGAFGGVAGTDKTIPDVIGAITGWFTNVFQKLMDEIAKLWGWKPGTGGAAIHAGITDVIATISGILGIGQSAAVSAANANAGLAAIAAGQKGGFFDEFELPIANDLPATDWKKTSTLADSYGTDGIGSAVFHASGAGLGWVEYVQISKPLLVPDMRCGVTLSKLPTWDLLVRSSWRIKVQCNPTDSACFQVEIAYDQARFHSVDDKGAITTLGAWQKIPKNALGVQYELEIKGNVLTLFRGGIQAATYSGVTPMAGRCVGFGAEKVAYVGGHPCINLAGVSWRPVT